MKQITETFADYFKEVIYGGIDGIVTTFAVVAGFAGAALTSETTTQLSFVVVLLFGLANLFADATSMGLGNYLSVRSEKDLYKVDREVERERLLSDVEGQKEKTKHLLLAKGFSDNDAAVLTRVYETNTEYWTDFKMHHEHGQADPRGENEVYTGFATFIAFMLFGAVPLLPFMLQDSGDPKVVFMYSIAGTFAALILLGVLKWRVVGGRFLPAFIEVVLVGGTAAIIAYFVGTFFAV